MIFNNFYMIFFGIFATILWIIGYMRFFKKPQLCISSTMYIKRRSFFRIVIFCLGIIAWCFITYALMEPRQVLGRMRDKSKLNDIFIVIDVSRSMLAEDFYPNRLEVAKEKLIEFVKLNPTDRIGIVIFGEKAFTLLPLSTDLKLIERMVDEISVGFLGSGTNIGDALGLAIARLAYSPAENKVIVLLTDGVSNVGNMTPIQAAEEAQDKKIKVYTIGIGKSEDRAVLKRPQGLGYQSIPGGSIDVETLKKISNITNGKNFFASDSDALKEVFSIIQKLEKKDIDVSSKFIYKDLYWNYLFIGVILLSIVEIKRRYLIREPV